MLYSSVVKNAILISIVFFSFGLVNLNGETTLFNRSNEDYPLSNTISLRDGDVLKLQLLPDSPLFENMQARFTQYHPELTLERLYRIKIPVKYSVNSSESKLSLFTAIVNILGKPETQVGYTYHSSRKDKDVVLFEKLYLSNSKGKQISGFTFSEDTLPKELVYYQYVDEANFQGSVFEQSIKVYDKFLSYQSTNIDPIRFFIFPIVKKKGMRNEVLFFTAGQYLYVYNCTQISKEPAEKKLGFSISMTSFFRKRMDVMAEWMEDQLLEIN